MKTFNFTRFGLVAATLAFGFSAVSHAAPQNYTMTMNLFTNGTTATT